MQNKPKINIIDLGFSENDALVYQALIQDGPSPAGNIISKTKLHRNVVYTSLDHLIDKKLVSSKKKNAKAIFESISPDILVTEFKEKQKAAEDLLEYYAETSKNKEVQEISVHEGNDEYLRLLTTLLESMPKGSTKYVLGTGGEDFMKYTMHPLWEQYHKAASKNSIRIRMLGYSSQKASIEPDTKEMKMYETKYIDSANPNPAGIHIYPEIDTVLNIIYSNKYLPVTAIRIKNKALTAGYLNLFNNLWNGVK
ncbi:MAG: transcriptional regulator TrmB [Candidatus Taylorbacteria bacterium]|nr:transcriptional regulator TrmB [Candidatus Taylorbacteria bacterium]